MQLSAYMSLLYSLQTRVRACKLQPAFSCRCLEWDGESGPWRCMDAEPDSHRLPRYCTGIGKGHGQDSKLARQRFLFQVPLIKFELSELSELSAVSLTSNEGQFYSSAYYEGEMKEQLSVLSPASRRGPELLVPAHRTFCPTRTPTPAPTLLAP